MAETFIVGDSVASVIPRLVEARQRNLAFTLDILGESVLSEVESRIYQNKYLDLIEQIAIASQAWRSNSLLDQSALGPIPKVNLSVKISSLDCRIDPMAFETSLQRLMDRLLPIVRAAKNHGFFVNFDMEQFSLKDLTKELFRRLILHPEFSNYRHLGVVVQAYLKSSKDDCQYWIDIAKQRGCPFTIRLVKGAYWDYEVIVADQNDWPIPVFEKKYETDANYEVCSRLLIDAYPFIELALGSHNIRSISSALSYAESRKLPRNAMEIQMLYGMADTFKSSLVRLGLRVREYDPVGDLIPGLSYLVRRLLENSSNDSFLQQTFLSKHQVLDLLKAPGK